MKSNTLIVSQRRNEILQILNDNKEINVKELSVSLGVSEITVRRDLNFLAERGQLVRCHGGAKVKTTKVDEELFVLNKKKNAIAKKAVEYIQPEETIFVNSSSTALLILEYINDKPATIITNNCNAINFKLSSNTSLVLTGGNVKFPKANMTGEFALNNISNVAASKSILGFSGVSIETGLTTANLEEVAVNRLMLEKCSGEKIILVDSSKLNYDHTFVSGDISLIDILITDSDANRQYVEQLESIGIKVILCNY